MKIRISKISEHGEMRIVKEAEVEITADDGISEKEKLDLAARLFSTVKGEDTPTE